MPLLAASCPSTTGVSSTPMPFAAASAARRRQVSGATELAMQMTEPGARRSSSPDCDHRLDLLVGRHHHDDHLGVLADLAPASAQLLTPWLSARAHGVRHRRRSRRRRIPCRPCGAPSAGPWRRGRSCRCASLCLCFAHAVCSASHSCGALVRIGAWLPPGRFAIDPQGEGAVRAVACFSTTPYSSFRRLRPTTTVPRARRRARAPGRARADRRSRRRRAYRGGRRRPPSADNRRSGSAGAWPRRSRD